MGRTWLERIKLNWAAMNFMLEFEAGPTKSLMEQKVTAAEKSLKAAEAKAQARSAGTKMTSAQYSVTNVVHDRETKDEEITEVAYECFDKNEGQNYAEKFSENDRNAFMCSLCKL
ncbi:hypothetical protein scyTo_0006842 [Scyliorhinus torazame]|uniref:Uncharacterized protein n=1 Tax=Scyliorhinus torazame TaxID=75743 RepID=A0A401NH80_SCYTO|nr:hypothetical protein [Scyliorhinus torazame]